MKMKKLLLTILPLFLISLAFAQVSVTPKVGVSIANYQLPDLAGEIYDGTPNVGFLGGVAIDIPVSGGFSIQPEFLFVQKGGNLDNEFTDEGVVGDAFVPSEGAYYLIYDNWDETLNYLELPLLFKYTFIGGTYGFYVLAGPTFSFGVSGEINFKLTDSFGDERFGPGDPTYNDIIGVNETFDPEFGNSSSDFYKAFDLGAAFGGGLYIEAGPGNIIIDARYGLGLSNIIPDDAGGDELTQKNSSIQLSLGYAIPLTGGYGD